MKLAASFVLGLMTSALGLVQGEHIQAKIRRGEIPVRAVNLGGWLVAEYWMTYTSTIWHGVPEDIAYHGEYAAMQLLGHAVGDQQFKQHRDSWITLADLAAMNTTLNTVRVPVGYWIAQGQSSEVTTDQGAVYAPGSLDYLDTLIRSWAVEANLAVMISFHAHRGSQNGYDHSAPPQFGAAHWAEDPVSQENSAQVARFLAERYKDEPAFLGMSLMNEPRMDDSAEPIVHAYYERSYDLIRSQTDNTCILAISPMLTKQFADPAMMAFMPEPDYTNVWHELHSYFKWGLEGFDEAGTMLAVDNYNSSVLSNWVGKPLFIGEWSLASADSAPFNDPAQFVDFGRKQLKIYNKPSAGWAFWAWRHDDDLFNLRTGWSLRKLLAEGVVDLTDFSRF